MTPKQQKRFFAKVLKDANEAGCWEWQAALTPDGYGKVKLNNMTARAHRVSYEFHKGKIEPTWVICHMCDNPPCVNPDHLFASTSKHNNTETWAKKRREKRYGEDNPSARLTREEVEQIREQYETTDLKYEELADVFGVSRHTIEQVVKYETWQ